MSRSRARPRRSSAGRAAAAAADRRMTMPAAAIAAATAAPAAAAAAGRSRSAGRGRGLYRLRPRRAGGGDPEGGARQESEARGRAVEAARDLLRAQGQGRVRQARRRPQQADGRRGRQLARGGGDGLRARSGQPALRGRQARGTRRAPARGRHGERRRLRSGRRRHRRRHRYHARFGRRAAAIAHDTTAVLDASELRSMAPKRRSRPSRSAPAHAGFLARHSRRGRSRHGRHPDRHRARRPGADAGRPRHRFPDRIAEGRGAGRR